MKRKYKATKSLQEMLFHPVGEGRYYYRPGCRFYRNHYGSNKQSFTLRRILSPPGTTDYSAQRQYIAISIFLAMCFFTLAIY